MGAAGELAQQPEHQVTLSQAFYLGTYEVTQSQWTAVIGTNPSHTIGDPNLPVENVSWNEAQQFIRKLNEKEGGNRYRLPSEAEWEFAVRCTKDGTEFTTAQDRLERYAWYETNADQRTHSVGQLLANSWGLYDMLGNVWEWCADWYGNYSTKETRDPEGPAEGIFRVYRGCGWERGTSETYCHSTSRHGARPNFRHPALGFRVAMTIATQK
jgi:formylglycine-generating enzyme required for sulfatase activity